MPHYFQPAQQKHLCNKIKKSKEHLNIFRKQKSILIQNRGKQLHRSLQTQGIQMSNLPEPLRKRKTTEWKQFFTQKSTNSRLIMRMQLQPVSNVLKKIIQHIISILNSQI